MVQHFSRKPSKPQAFWGPNIYCRLAQEQTPDKVKESLEQQLILNGRPSWLWQPVRPSLDTGLVACTCLKDTTQNSDFKCASCYGTSLIPGYFKFLHETVHFSSAEFASFTLTNTEIDRNIKPNRLRLAAGQTTGTIVTQDKAYSNPKSAPWEFELAAYRKVAGDTLALDFSTDSGSTWTALVLTPGTFGFRSTVVPAPVGTGVIRFRVTLTRLSGSSVESPSFEIVRARHVRLEHVNPELHKRPDYEDGQILVLKSWNQELAIRSQMLGRQIEHVGDRMQTTPLDFFDLSITRETPPAVLDDREAGPHPFIEYTSGTRLLSRYVITQVNIDDTINNVVSHQAFTERLSQDELYRYVW